MTKLSVSNQLDLFQLSLIYCFFSEFLQLQDAEDSLREKEAKLKESEEEHGNDLENSLIQLEQEQQRFLFLLKNEIIISLERSVLA